MNQVESTNFRVLKTKISHITLRDVANASSLSLTTVSAVLAGKHANLRIAEATAERIRKIARDLGYVPNMAARNLKGKSFEKQAITVALITSAAAPINLIQKFLIAFRRLVERRVKNRGKYTIILELFEGESLKDLPGLLEGRLANAAIICNTTKKDDAWLETVKFSYPVVIFGRRIPGHFCVKADEETAGQNAADILLESGVKVPALLVPPRITASLQSRLNGFNKRAEALKFGSPRVIQCKTFSEKAASEAVLEALKQRPRFDGLFSITDTLAVGAYHAFYKTGIKVPDDMVVVGIGDLDHAPFLTPPLTTVCSESESSALNAVVKMLLELLEGKRSRPVCLEHDTKVVFRESTLKLK